MKKLLCITFLALFFISCEKDGFDLDNPNVEEFVHQIKSGTYNQYEKGENGADLWLKMPNFTKKHIPSLIDLSKDTTHITNFPTNPISSRAPFPSGKKYYILGECLLWAVEGIRNDTGYGSLSPYLIDTAEIESEKYKGLNGVEILIVRDIYKKWWNENKDKDWKNIDPLRITSYRWF